MDLETTGIDSLLDTIMGVIVMMLAAATAVGLFFASRNYDETVADQLQNKSSTYFVPYAVGEDTLYMDVDTVVEDIAASKGIIIKIDGTALTLQQISAVRNHDAQGIREIKRMLGSSEYRKVTTYDMNGNMTETEFFRRQE